MSINLQRFNRGFTLVELSIVLIIIGFLIAGIAAGSSMIKSAQINSIISDFQRYQTSYNNFIGRYAQAPGDFNNAWNIWKADCDGASSNSASLCNGNSDGKIGTGSSAAKGIQEIQSAWKELALSGMVSSTIAIVDGSSPAVPGTNVPLSKLLGAGYSLVNGGTDVNGLTATNDGVNSALWGSSSSVNMVMIGKPTGATSATTVNTALVSYSALPPVDAYSIDTKLDDGNPLTGIVRASVGADSSASIKCLDSSVTEGAYLLNSPAVGCVVGMAVNN